MGRDGNPSLTIRHEIIAGLACRGTCAYGPRMATDTDIVHLGKRIAAGHGWPAAKAFKAYAMNDGDRAAISRCAIDLLGLLPAGADAAQMSAAFAVTLERSLSAPIHVMAGPLVVDGTTVSDDHTWVMVGPYIVDIALFRLAASAQAPAVLARHIDVTFGRGKALYVDHWHKTRLVGLRYGPLRVLGSDEVTARMGEAFHLIKQARNA